MLQVSPELLQAIVSFLPSKDMALRTPALQLVATLTQAVGPHVFSRGHDLEALAQLENAYCILDQLLTTSHTLCVSAPTALSTIPSVATPPRVRPTLHRLCLEITDWTDDSRVLACLQHVFAVNAASLQSIEVHVSAPHDRAPQVWRSQWQHGFLTTLVQGLVSLRHVASLSLRSVHGLRFPEQEATALAAWIDETPLTSLRMENINELSPGRQLWAKPTLTSLSLDPIFRLDDSATFAHSLTYVDLQLFDARQLKDMATTLANSPIKSLHVRLMNNTSRQDELATQGFFEIDLPRFAQLTTLHLTNIHLSTTHCLTLALLLPRFKHLALTTNKLGDTGVLALTPFLRHASLVETLTLVDQGFGDAGASALTHTPRLCMLNLSRNNIKLGGVLALSGLLPQLSRLATWRLCSNPLGAKGLVFLLRAWTYVELDTTTLIDARSTVGSEDDSRVVDALIAALPSHRTCLAALEAPAIEIKRNNMAELMAEAPLRDDRVMRQATPWFEFIPHFVE
ncbi:hypothetical protein SDRG_09719 [Saprolegnia diclina VS20]|uniref:RNI-like protein n=1 Tax=Saprolegnia diclina (strain VS20) TaxID=1156394 RepID=T0RRJ6_SAPDV|nr:hypothetical protein SDRG_09719 [Saprolegnia diclina VS20]EQC32747.1 hypothetical protein SDRG_09719 [Saprolegnia diclina VS20]|eukprot:XP_008613891.1 hypothetical protein SDRG_09719 [Saprolegnia diclina VS20]